MPHTTLLKSLRRSIYPTDQDRYCPWEDQDKIGFLEGLLRTLKESLFTPREFFYKLAGRGRVFNPATICLDNRDIRHPGELRVGFFFGSFLVWNNKVARLLDHNARHFGSNISVSPHNDFCIHPAHFTFLGCGSETEF